jgi:hypothetical protein
MADFEDLKAGQRAGSLWRNLHWRSGCGNP